MAAHGIPSNRAAARRAHGRQQSSHGVPPPCDLLREGGDQHDQRDDDDRGEDLVEDPGRWLAEGDRDPHDREGPCNGQDDEGVPGPTVRTLGRGGQEAADSTVALAPGEEQREDQRSEGEDERDERGRDAAQRGRRGEGHAQAGQDKDHPESAGTGSGGGRVETSGGRCGSRHGGQLLWWCGSSSDCARHRGRPHRGRPDRSLRVRPERGGRVDDERTPEPRGRHESKNAGRRAPGSRPARWSQRAGQSSWRSNTSFAPRARKTIEIAQPIGVSIEAGWPLATSIAHDPDRRRREVARRSA